jgi:hypothetical protein
MARTKEQLLNMLETDTHAFWREEFVAEINEAFGTKLRAHVGFHDNHDPKGLSLEDPHKVAAIGMASFEIAPLICRALGVTYTPRHGRGSLVRACVIALREHEARNGKR